jgi:hypothetical protein
MPVKVNRRIAARQLVLLEIVACIIGALQPVADWHLRLYAG